MNEERLTLTVEECAKVLGIGRQLAYEKVKTGEIPALRIGRRFLIPRAALERLLNFTGDMTESAKKAVKPEHDGSST